MARLTDDQRYARALALQQQVLAEEEQAFRKRLADRVVAMAATGLEQGGDTFDEQAMRRALADYPRVYFEEAMTYITRALERVGEVELAKKLAEAHDQLDPDELPEEFLRGFEELRRGGYVAEAEAERDGPTLPTLPLSPP